MAMVMLAGVGGLGEPLTAFNDFAPGPAVPVQYSVTPPNTPFVEQPWYEKLINPNQTLVYQKNPDGTKVYDGTAMGLPDQREDPRMAAQRWSNQCIESNHKIADGKMVTDVDNLIADIECNIGAYKAFPVIGYIPPSLVTQLADLQKRRVEAVAADAKAAAAVKAAADKIIADQAKDKAAKDKLAIVETGSGTGEILGMDSKTFMLVAAAGLVLFMMEKKG